MVTTAEEAAVKVLRQMEVEAAIERILRDLYTAIRRYEAMKGTDKCFPSRKSTPQSITC